MPLPLLAYPVLHSSGAWIAYMGSGYLAGTLSSSWIGAFILGNGTLLSSLGLVSAAGVAGATGVLSSVGAAATAGIAGGVAAGGAGLGSALASIGLGGVAAKMGIAPVATFLGLTPIGWAVTGGAAVVATGATAIFSRQYMKKLNEEREKGGLDPIRVSDLLEMLRGQERASMLQILQALSCTRQDVSISENEKTVLLADKSYSIDRLRYKVRRDSSEVVQHRAQFGFWKTVYVVRPADGPLSIAPAQ